MLTGPCQVVPFDAHLAEPDVHVGRATETGMRSDEIEPGVARPLRTVQMPLGEAHVGEAERAAERVGEMGAPGQVVDRRAVPGPGKIEVAGRPAREAQQPARGTTTNVVVGRRELQDTIGLGGRGREVA